MSKKNFIIVIFFLVAVAGIVAVCCFWESLRAYYFVLTNDYDGETVLANENIAVANIENILKNPNGYKMKAFNRAAISHKVKKTPKTTHSFFVIYDSIANWHTLSFCATGKLATSQGAWAWEIKYDVESFEHYLLSQKDFCSHCNNINDWQVEQILFDKDIAVVPTLQNVLNKIRSSITYYFCSEINPNDNHDNCNSALWEIIN
ncbi:MAG: hypothetical protein LBC89_05265 [Bacteroidales bacterium]|jgi:hypothetical protein|nr:hypothetical protein [Bacteroidales bacterium]